MTRRLACLLIPVTLTALSGLAAPAPRAVAPPALPGTAGCTTSGCHDDLRTAPFAHRPVAEGVCGICHRAEGDGSHRFRLARDGSGLCRACHREIGAGFDAGAHAAVQDNGCTLCHDPHGTGRRFLLSAAPVARACETCHDDVAGRAGAMHESVIGHRCTTCHDPHARRSITMDAGGTASTCFACHPAARRSIESVAFVHEPVRTGTCDRCHAGHDLVAGGVFREEVPDLCYGCHESVRETVTNAPYGHAPAAAPGGCVTCHDPHGSNEAAGLRGDPATLCHGCHDRTITTAAGETLAAVAREIDESAFLHGPVQQHDCGACHDSHGGDHPRLLTANYTTEFYAPFDLANFDLCFGCHPERGVLTERTTRLTEFRNGDLNLHHLHVNKPENGRTCRACHATHGSNAPKHIRDWVQYGAWKLPIEYTMTETGGSCRTGCHVVRAYDRVTPVTYGAASD